MKRVRSLNKLKNSVIQKKTSYSTHQRFISNNERLRSKKTGSGCTSGTQVRSTVFIDLKSALFSRKT